MSIELEVVRDAEEAGRKVGALLARTAAEAVAARGRASVALSKAPSELVGALVAAAPEWPALGIYQVDERVAAAGTTDRNLTALLAELPPEAVDSLLPMPVEAPDLEDAARMYEEELPDALDVVHLGLGEDGHAASLVPDDDVLEVSDRRVAVTGEHAGFRRMTLTYPALASARQIVWLITGEEKAAALARLLARDQSIPAARISNGRQIVVADEAAAA